jgi:hypothetical protein
MRDAVRRPYIVNVVSIEAIQVAPMKEKVWRDRKYGDRNAGAAGEGTQKDGHEPHRSASGQDDDRTGHDRAQRKDANGHSPVRGRPMRVVLFPLHFRGAASVVLPSFLFVPLLFLFFLLWPRYARKIEKDLLLKKKDRVATPRKGCRFGPRPPSPNKDDRF